MGEKVLELPRGRADDVLRFAPSGRSLLVGFGVVLVSLGLYGLARETSLFAVSAVRVTGADQAVTAQVRSALARYEGNSLVSVDAGSVAQRVESLPTVRLATVDRAFPHTLRVRVVPELPVAVLRRGAESWLVSARGRVIAPLALGGARTLPRIWLPQTTQFAVGSFLGDDPGGLAARSLSALVGSGFPRRISFVRALDGRITLGVRGGLEIRLGVPVDLPLKIAIARAILPGLALPSRGGPDYLDLDVPERPVAGRNPQPAG
jgi:cell division protein FtsQ